jgi:hypothetical protein
MCPARLLRLLLRLRHGGDGRQLWHDGSERQRRRHRWVRLGTGLRRRRRRHSRGRRALAIVGPHHGHGGGQRRQHQHQHVERERQQRGSLGRCHGTQLARRVADRIQHHVQTLRRPRLQIGRETIARRDRKGPRGRRVGSQLADALQRAALGVAGQDAPHPQRRGAERLVLDRIERRVQ